MSSKALLVLSLTSTVLSAPYRAPILARDDCSYDDCPTLNMSDPKAICDWTLDDSDMSIAQNLWWETAAGYQLDSYIKAYGSDDWPRNMYRRVFGENTQPNLDCSTDTSTCALGKECKDFMKADPVNGGSYYWALLAATRAHDTFHYMYQEIFSDSFIDSLSVDDIVSDMGAGSTQPSPFAMISGAFGMASALTAPVPGLSPALGFIGGSFGMAGQFYTPPDPTSDINDAVRDFFSGARDAIDDTLFDSMGSTASDGTEPDPDSLQSQTEDYYNDTPIGRFFADGKFLIENAAPALGPVMDKGHELWRGSLATRVLGQDPLNYVIWARDDMDQEACETVPTDIHDTDSYLWQDDRCFVIIKPVQQVTIGGGYYSLDEISNDVLGKLVDTYKVNLSDMYANAWDCHLNHDDGDVDVTALPYDGTMPACFYNLEVVEGDFDSSYGGWD